MMPGKKSSTDHRNLASESSQARADGAKRKAELDWDDLIARLRDMLERIDHHHDRNH
jgi:hypothetical protein